MNQAPVWNTLEVAKLLASCLTPLLVVGIGVYIHRLTKSFEQMQWRNQKLIEKRLSIYDRLAPMLNDNLCYFTYVGSWKERKPPEVVASKRMIDKEIHLAAPLFSPNFYAACSRFQDLCFEPFTGWGRDAKLKSLMERRKEANPASWDSDWDEMFSREASNPKEIRQAYADVMTCFAEEIGINDGFSIPSSFRIPKNIR